MRIVVCLLAFMASVFTTSAVIIDTPCMGCLTTMEAMYLLSREAKMANGELPFVNDIAMMLCHSSYFNLFIDGVQDGCRAMLEADPDSFKSAISEVLGTDADIYTPNGAKLNYFHFAKKICVDTFRACHAGVFRDFHKQSERSPCVACGIIIDEMTNFARVIPSTNASHIMSTVCPSLGYKNQPAAWLEDECFELLDENTAALRKIFSGPTATEPKDTEAICRQFDLGCPRRSDL